MSVNTLLSVSVPLWHIVTTQWAPTSALATKDSLMLIPATPELFAQVSFCVCVGGANIWLLFHFCFSPCCKRWMKQNKNLTHDQSKQTENL